MKTVKDHSGKEYKQTKSGTCYHSQTDDKLIAVLEHVMRKMIKVKIYQGDTETGEVWGEEHDIIGYISRSTGSIKIPWLVHERAYGGPALLDHCILKVVSYPDRANYYQHPKFQQPIVEIKPAQTFDSPGKYTHETWYNGSLYGRHTSLKSAQICAAKLR